MKLTDFEKRQIAELRKSKAYREASILTIILDLMMDKDDGNGADKEELFAIVNVAEKMLRE